MTDSLPVFSSQCRKYSRTAETVCPLPLTPQGIMQIVQRICTRAGVSDPSLSLMRPHDLRRTFAQLAEDGGADLKMIQHSMGHASIVTTEKYLQGIQNLKMGQTAPDHIRVKVTRRKKEVK